MENFNLSKMREFLPKELPKMPSWPAAHRSMNPDDDYENEPRSSTSNAPKEVEMQNQKRSASMDMMTLEEPKPIGLGPKSNLDLIDECDNFPYYHTQPKLYLAHINTYYALHVPEYPDVELGFILPSVVEVFRGLPDWLIDDEDRTLTLVSGHTEEERSKAVAFTTQAMRATNHFRVLNGWRNGYILSTDRKGNCCSALRELQVHCLEWLRTAFT